jgi:peroxiredoxin
MAASRGLKVLAGTGLSGLVLLGSVLLLRGRSPGPAPDFSVVDLAGKTIRLSGLRGKIVVLNVWATWCPPCRDEMPSMERLYQQLRGPDFELLAVSEDEGSIDAVRAFARELGVTFPIAHDPERQVGSRYGVWGYPETFIIDREGRIVERVIGPRLWDAPEQVAMLRGLLSDPGRAGLATGP